MSKKRPDEYYINDLYEFVRFGNNVYLHNNMSEKQRTNIINKLKDKYDELKSNIDIKIKKIKKDVLECDPIQLLQFSSDMYKIRGVQSLDLNELPFELPEENEPYIATEFIQSIYASSPANHNINTNEDNSTLFFKIISEIEELIDTIKTFYLCWASKSKESYSEFDDDFLKLLFEEQLLFWVRGNRYQVFEKEYFEKLLLPHNEIFLEVFGISSNDIINGITKIQYALSQQKFDTIAQLGNLFDEFESIDSNEICIEQFHSKNQEELNDIFGKLFGTSLCDVQQITNWTNSFIDELSWEQNSCPEFWNGEYGGWPIMDFPISKRPFIKLNGHSYCFDYYSFVDNFYRAVQKATTRVKKDYQWSKVQQSASENMVAEIFKSLLPGCKTYISNYYPINKSLKQMAENDLIVIYDNTLIIVEVKAGSFVYTSPITDFAAHIQSYKKLIEEADFQCQRIKEYLERSNIPKLYNEDKTKKVEVNMSAISFVYMMSVTVDNINAFAARAEKLNFLKLRSKAISIAIDDLMVYREYFDSPLVFLHFLKQRSLATQNSLIALNDELDHLGMYIEHNCYNYQTKDIEKGTKIIFTGYRDSLNAYFDELYHPKLNPNKPIQRIPSLFSQIIEYLTVNEIKNRSLIANYLLDFAADAKDNFCKQVEYILKRQKEKHTIIPFFASGNAESLRFTLFINQFPYKKDIIQQTEYALATLSWNKEIDRALIVLTFKNDKFEKIYFKILTPNDINEENRERIIKLGEQNAKMRILEYQRNNPGKIGRNSLCPCGSGKKYKKCCGI